MKFVIFSNEFELISNEFRRKRCVFNALMTGHIWVTNTWVCTIGTSRKLNSKANEKNIYIPNNNFTQRMNRAVNEFHNLICEMCFLAKLKRRKKKTKRRAAKKRKKKNCAHFIVWSYLPPHMLLWFIHSHFF